MAVEWFAMLRGKVLGPFTPDQLRGLVREGKVTEETSVRKGREGDWVPAGRVQRLFETPGAPEREDGPAVLLVADDGGPPRSGHEPPVLPVPGEIPANGAVPVPPVIANERFYINERGIIVTGRWLQADDGTVCSVGQIAMVRRGTGPRSNPWFPIIAIVIGVSLMSDAFPRTPVGPFPGGPTSTSILPFPLLLGIAALAYGISQLARRKSGPWLLVSLSSGESKEFNHPDSAFLDRLRDAIFLAIRNGA
jgi:hypothetical protein